MRTLLQGLGTGSTVICTNMCKHKHMRPCTSVCASAYVCVYICMCMCVRVDSAGCQGISNKAALAVM